MERAQPTDTIINIYMLWLKILKTQTQMVNEDKQFVPETNTLQKYIYQKSHVVMCDKWIKSINRT